MNKFIIIVFVIIAAAASPTLAKGTRGNGKIDTTATEGNLGNIYDFFSFRSAFETISSFVKNLFQVDNGSEQSCCGECWCIPDHGDECPAPTNLFPQVYTVEMVEDFASKVLVHPDTHEVVTSNNLYQLDCDPFDGVSEGSSPPFTAYQNTCRLNPEQSFDSTTEAGYSDAVCAFKYPEGDCNTYTYKTYPTRQDAEDDNAFVTHATQCGACSSAQDLSVYLSETDLTAAGTKCTIKGIFGRSVDCYMNLGFTEACAKVWAFNSQNTAENCLGCGLPGTSPGPAPECELNPCVQCDAEKSGPTFNAYAGRTRRNSGIRSELVRSCTSIENIQQYTCSDMTLPDEEEISLCAV
jgi:hypothetical protein